MPTPNEYLQYNKYPINNFLMNTYGNFNIKCSKNINLICEIIERVFSEQISPDVEIDKIIYDKLWDLL
jgi:hypothetical protein